MALGAVDLVLGDVLVVHELVIADLRQVALAVVAGLAAFAGHVAVAADHVGVATLAVDALLEGQLMRELSRRRPGRISPEGIWWQCVQALSFSLNGWSLKWQRKQVRESTVMCVPCTI